MIGCDWSDCTVPALTALTFRAQPGHVHVCKVHESIDREHADVTRSAGLTVAGCPWCAGGKPSAAAIIGTAIPTPL